MTKLVQKKELAEFLGIKIRQIGNYIKSGMPIHSIGKRNAQLFDAEACKRWRDKTINKTMSMKTKKPITKEVEVSIDDVVDEDGNIVAVSDIERKMKADADDAELKVQLNTLKLAEAEGRVVDANDLDRAMSELAVVHKTDKIHDENLLPVLLENKDAGEIKLLLQEHNYERLKMLDKIVNREFKSEETMYDIVEAVLQKLKEGVEPESLVKRINGSLV